jgi:hypothetical protein
MCVNDELTTADITCGDSPTFNGCFEQQTAYNECI